MVKKQAGPRAGLEARAPDPRRLDVVRLAAGGGRVEGVMTAAQLGRLGMDAPLAGSEPATWVASGEQREPPGASPQTWLHLQAAATVTLTCQRCLQPVTQPLVADRWIRFVRDEALAEKLDEESEDDVLALPSRGLVDVLALVEDELILALPIVPRHEACPQPLWVPPAEADEAVEPDETRTHPFEALAALKRRPGGSGHGGEGGGAR